MSLIGYSLSFSRTRYPDLLEKSNPKSSSQHQQTQSSRPGVLLAGPLCTRLARPWTLHWIGGDAELAKGEGNPGMEGP